MIKKIYYEKKNNEVGYIRDNITKIKKKDLNQLLINSKLNKNNKSRFCFHKSKSSQIHEMVIYHKKNYFVRPHKHIKKTESLHVIKGEADIIFFKNNGDILDIIKMGDYLSNKIYYYKMNIQIYHTLIIKSAYLIFHEVTTGPFKKNQTVFAPWAPKKFNKSFKIFLDKKIKEYEKKLSKA